MNLKELNHSLTPEALRDLNANIVAQLDKEDPTDYADLKALLVQRDKVINAHLHSLHDDEKRQFAQKEIVVNHALEQVAQTLLQSSKEEIIQFVRGKAAVKKYK